MNRFLILILVLALNNEIQGQSVGRVDEETLKCIVNIDGKGAGFLVARPLPSDKSKSKIYLVTNKHMIGDWSLVDPFIPNPSINVYLYLKDTTVAVTPVKVPISDISKKLLPIVKIHKNPKIDIVAIDITSQIVSVKNLDVKYFDLSYLIPLNSIATEAYTGVGDQVYAIGYPAGITSTNTHKPIVKSGYISSALSGDLIINSDWINRAKKKIKTSAEGKFFLVDGLIIGGNSGGPIVHPKERKFKVENKQIQYTQGEIPNLIFGIVSFGLGNTGISVIYSCDHIIEVLNDHKLE